MRALVRHRQPRSRPLRAHRGRRPALPHASLSAACSAACWWPFRSGLLSGYNGGGWIDDAIMRVLEALQALPVFVLALFVIGMLGHRLHGPRARHAGAGRQGRAAAGGLVPALLRPGHPRRDVGRGAGGVRRCAAGRRGVALAHHPGRAAPQRDATRCWSRASCGSASPSSPRARSRSSVWAIQPPQASLGNILAAATSYLMLGAWWFSIIPGLVILLVTIGINLARRRGRQSPRPSALNHAPPRPLPDGDCHDQPVHVLATQDARHLRRGHRGGRPRRLRRRQRQRLLHAGSGNLTPKRGGTLKIAMPAVSDYINPLVATTSAVAWVTAPVVETLYTYDDDDALGAAARRRSAQDLRRRADLDDQDRQGHQVLQR